MTRPISSPLLSSLTFGLLSLACARGATPAETPPADQPASQAPANVAAATPEVIDPIASVRASGSFLPPLPRAVTSFGAASTGSRLYVLGGYFGTPHSYSKEGQSTAVWAYDASGQDGWHELSQLPQGLQGLFAAFAGERLCHFGGNHADNVASEPTRMTSVTDARCLDPSTGQWIGLPPLPQGRSSHGGAVIDGRVYLVGGWTLAGDASSGTFLGNIVTLDPAAPEKGWQSIPAPFSRRALGVAEASGRLVVVGGMTSDTKISTDVDVYDPKSGAWSKGPSYPGDAFGIAATSQGGVVYASGRDGILRSWAPGQASWTDVRRLAFGRFFHEIRPLGQDLAVLGGIGGMHTRGRNRVVERVHAGPGLSYGQLTLADPGVAKNRQGFLIHGEDVYFFGGNVSLEQHDFGRQHFTSEGWLFSLSTLLFEKGAPYPLRRQSMQVAETEAGALAIGGFGHEPLLGDDTQAVTHPEVFAYDWEERTWSSLPALPRGRTQFGLAQHGSELWLFGGLNYDPNRKDAFDHDRSIWTLDLGAQEPSFRVTDLTLPGPRRAFAGAALEDRYYLVGGMKEGFQLVDDCLEFSFSTKEFSPFPCPAARLGGDLIAARGKLYLVGGSVKTGEGLVESRRVDVYDPKAKKWSPLDFELPLSAHHLRAFPYQEQILLVTTQNDAAELTVAILNPE